MDWRAEFGIPIGDFQAKFNELLNAGWRATWLQVFEDGGSARVNALWEPGDGRGWEANHRVPAADLESRFRAQADRGLRLRCTGGYVDDGQLFYADLWDSAASPSWQAEHAIRLADYQAHFNEMVAAGWTLVHLNACAWGGEALFSTIWEADQQGEWASEHFLSDPEFQQRAVTAGVLNRRMTMAVPYSVGGEPRWAVIWGPLSVPFEARHGRSGTDFADDFEDLRLEGFRPVSIGGCSTTGRGDRYTAVFVNDGLPSDTWQTVTTAIDTFLENQSAPGLSVALAVEGRLVFAATRGNADISGNERLRTRHRMRIASVSKPITSVAIHQLIQDGRLALSDKVLGSSGILGTTYGRLSYSANQLAVTVEQLLNHTTGGWDNQGSGAAGDIDGMGDPMFAFPGDQATLIGQVLDSYPLQTPGSVYAYSNFGYCLLGRILERRTGLSYSDAVHSLVFDPVGVAGMTIAGNTLADRQTDEVEYLGDGDDPYGIDVARMDAHGGWVANAISLVRFGVHVSGDGDKQSLLNPGEVTSMMTGSARNSGYAHGWGVNSAGVRNHLGGLPGTMSALESDPATRTTWAALVNTRPATAAGQNSLTSDLMTMMRALAAASWPNHDFLENDPRQPGVRERFEDPPVILQRRQGDERVDLDPPIVLPEPDERIENLQRRNPIG